MHTKAVTDAPLTDSMRLFQWGLEGGKPPEGEISVQPEWFYKGNASFVQGRLNIWQIMVIL
jgi:hypothetical protein